MVHLRSAGVYSTNRLTGAPNLDEGFLEIPRNRDYTILCFSDYIHHACARGIHGQRDVMDYDQCVSLTLFSEVYKELTLQQIFFG